VKIDADEKELLDSVEPSIGWKIRIAPLSKKGDGVKNRRLVSFSFPFLTDDTNKTQRVCPRVCVRAGCS
jgi:hypothetical protein